MTRREVVTEPTYNHGTQALAGGWPAAISAVRPSLEEVLEALDDYIERSSDAGISFRCPLHEDDYPSGWLRLKDGGDYSVTCYACDLEQQGNIGWFADFCRFVRGEPLQHSWTSKPGSGRSRGRGSGRVIESKLVASYHYRDRDGLTVGVKLRFWNTLGYEHPDGRHWVHTGYKKTFCWDRESGAKAGNACPLYHLPEVLKQIQAGQTVYVVEGEKDADAVMEHGQVATTGPNGGNEWTEEHVSTLSGGRIVVVADDDPVGVSHAKALYARLLHIADDVRVVKVRGYKDVSEAYEAGADALELLEPIDVTEDPTVTARARAAAEQHRGQMRLAVRMSQEQADSLRYVHGLGWHGWDGTRWARCVSGEETRRAKATIDNGIAELELLSDRERAELAQDLRSVQSATGAKGMLSLAGDLLPLAISHDDIDTDPELLNTPGGTLDLGSGGLRPARREDHITMSTRAAPGQPSREFEAFLERVLPDPEVRAFTQRLLGYSLLGVVREHILPIFTGEGANGKGTLRDAVLHALGDYALEVDPELLMESRQQRHGTFKMQLRKRRVVFCSETDQGRRFSESTMKRLVGGDRIEANYMHRDPITFEPSHTLIMLTNHLPLVSATDPAIWRRILVVPFDVVIPPEEQDGRLPERLKADAPAVIAWLVEGYRQYVRTGLAVPDAVRARTEEYQVANDSLAQFIEDECVTGLEHKVASKALRDAYESWAVAQGMGPATVVPARDFARLIERRGFPRTKIRGSHYYKGLKLVAD